MSDTPTFIEHLAGDAGIVQHCVRCGCVLVDASRALLYNERVPCAWNEGTRVYVRGIERTATKPINEPVEPCTP